MKTNALDQLERICRQSLSRVAKLNKSFKKFFVEPMICFLSIPGRINFSQMARYGSSCESRFRQNFKKKFDGTVDVDNPREDRFVVSTVDDGDTKVTLYHAKLYAVCLKRVVGVAIAVYDDKDKKTQTRNENSLDFAFNASLTAVNIAKAFAKESGLDLSVESVKLLTHNAVVIQRVLSLSGKRPNLNLNQDNFKELLFYGVKFAA